MPERVLRLGIDPRQATRGAREFRRATDEVGRGASQAARSTDQLSGSFDHAGDAARFATRALAALGITVGIGGLIRGIVATNREFERLTAQLQTTEGSAQAAQAAFARIEEFAIRTPFEIENLTSALVQLRVRGANPTNEQLTALGNLASSFTRDITDVSAAVASATAGMTLPLRNLGFEASVAGEQITLQFGEASVTVERSAQAIVEAMAQLTGGRLAGAMEREMNTINGAMSNLQDSAGKLARAIGEAGLNQRILESVQRFDQLVNSLAENRREIAFFVKVAIEGARAIVQPFVTLARTLFNVGQIIGELGNALVAFFKRDFAEASAAVERGKLHFLDIADAVNDNKDAWERFFAAIGHGLPTFAAAAEASDVVADAVNRQTAALLAAATAVADLTLAEQEYAQSAVTALQVAIASMDAVVAAYDRRVEATERVRAAEEALARAEKARADAQRNFYLQTGLGLVGDAAGDSEVGGLVTGTAGGAMAGFAVGGPIGAVVGGVAGLVSGLIGMSRRAREERERQMELERQERSARARLSFVTSQELAAREAAAEGHKDLAERIRQEIQFSEEFKKAFDDNISPALVAELRRVQALEKSALVAEQAADAERKLAEEREKQQQVIEDITVRAITALGRSTAAGRAGLVFAQRREIASADVGNIPALDILHEMERNAFEQTIALEAISALAQEEIAAVDRQIALQERQLQAAHEQVRVAEQQLAEAERVVSTLANFRNQLLLGPLTTLSPVQQLEEARRQFERVRAAALGGDAAAAAQLPEAARAMLEASREVNASSGAFVADFEAVRTALDQIQGGFADEVQLRRAQLKEAERHTQQLEQQIAALADQKVAIEANANMQVQALREEFELKQNNLWSSLQALLGIGEKLDGLGTKLDEASVAKLVEIPGLFGDNSDVVSEIKGLRSDIRDLRGVLGGEL